MIVGARKSAHSGAGAPKCWFPAIRHANGLRRYFVLSAFCPSPTAQPPKSPSQSSWLQVVSHLDAKFGGIAALLPMFCAAAEAEGARSPVTGFCSSLENNNPLGPPWD